MSTDPRPTAPEDLPELPEDRYSDREMSWLAFNNRVLDLAKDQLRIPLLERAAQGAPAESDINEHLGDAYWKANRRLDARYAWRAALVAADDDEKARIKAKIDNGLTAKP